LYYIPPGELKVYKCMLKERYRLTVSLFLHLSAICNLRKGNYISARKSISTILLDCYQREVLDGVSVVAVLACTEVERDFGIVIGGRSHGDEFFVMLYGRLECNAVGEVRYVVSVVLLQGEAHGLGNGAAVIEAELVCDALFYGDGVVGGLCIPLVLPLEATVMLIPLSV